MKLLLTSAGLTNQKIANALLELAELPANKIKICFVPTAANLELGDKEWLIDNLIAFKNQGYKSIDILDIVATPRENWLKRLQDANVICFGGGNENYLAKVLQDTGVAEALPELLKSRIYMGISAGSMVAGTFAEVKTINELIYPEEAWPRLTDKTLELITINFLPHLNSEYFKSARKENIKNATGFTAPVYALDDQSALKIVDGKIEIVGNGKSFVITK